MSPLNAFRLSVPCRRTYDELRALLVGYRSRREQTPVDEPEDLLGECRVRLVELVARPVVPDQCAG